MYLNIVKRLIKFESILNELFVWKTYNNCNCSKDEVFICNTLIIKKENVREVISIAARR